MNAVLFANKLFATETLVVQLVIALGIVYLLFFRKKQFAMVAFFTSHALLIAFGLSLGAMLGSLFYSEFAGFAPCDLCWFQRIFMYPLVLLLGVALIKKDNHIVDYVLSLSVIGLIISLYHNYMYYYNGGLNVYCLFGSSSISCIKRYVFEFGYITIPMMALTHFAFITLLFILLRLEKNRNHE